MYKKKHYPDRKKRLIYCSRTVPEIEKALAELKRLMDYRAKELGYREPFLGLGLSSRKNLCLHPKVSKEKRGDRTDAECNQLTAPWVRDKVFAERKLSKVQRKSTKHDASMASSNGQESQNNMSQEINIEDHQQLCAFYETLEAISEENSSSMPLGVYTLDDLRGFGQQKTLCPYFLARRMVLKFFKAKVITDKV
jgi:DNA excision repair protein ERCC-2